MSARTEQAFVSAVCQESRKARSACRRCGAPSFVTFDLVGGGKREAAAVEAPRARIAHIGGPWARAQLWGASYQSLTCRRCGSVRVLPPAPATHTPTTTPTTLFCATAHQMMPGNQNAQPPLREAQPPPEAWLAQAPSRERHPSGAYYGRSISKIRELKVGKDAWYHRCSVDIQV
jgi:hypothetical protein